MRVKILKLHTFPVLSSSETSSVKVQKGYVFPLSASSPSYVQQHP